MAPAHAPVHRQIAGAILVISLAIAACSSTASATPGAPTAQPFGLRTAAVQPQACMDALIVGKLVKHAQSGLGITSADGQQTAVEWPFRYSAWVLNGRIVLLDETGKVVAREGDEITVGGGFGTQLWYACGPVMVTRAGT
jgi:hypothetical protein